MLTPELINMLLCPRCKGSVVQAESGEVTKLVCEACQLQYPVEDGIPIMLKDRAQPLARQNKGSNTGSVQE